MRKADAVAARVEVWADTLDSLKRLFEGEVPKRRGRTETLALLEQRLDPAKPVDGEEEMARRWIELQGAWKYPNFCV